MSSDTIIKVENVSKKFCKTMYHIMKYGTVDITKDFLGVQIDSSHLREGEFWAVDDVSFEIKKGETFGIMGVNGSGKSTMLKMLNGIFMPDKGNITVHGRVGALIEVGAGFHPMLSGRENVFINGSILGLTKKEIIKKFDDIVEFADIGSFIDAPVKNYSSGMRVRLGFAIAVHVHPEILLIDEILAVGDVNFQKKCFEKINQLRNEGTSIVFISHTVSVVERLCSRGVLFSSGKQLFLGNIRQCIQEYFYQINKNTLNQSFKLNTVALGTGDVSIDKVFVFEEGRDKSNPEVEFGKNIIIEFDYKFLKKEDKQNQVRLTINSAENHAIQEIVFNEAPYSDGLVYDNEKFYDLNKEGTVQLKIESPRLFPDTYSIHLAFTKVNSNIYLGGGSSVASFSIVQPGGQKLYMNYGAMPVVCFDYEVTVRSN